MAAETIASNATSILLEHSPRTSSCSSIDSPASANAPSSPFTEFIRSPTDEVFAKIEELDDDELGPSNVPFIPQESSPPTTPTSAVVKRPRGRPRKHFVVAPVSVLKSVKGRSKTGCITCRRRKKKCDETKPWCMHCQKNNVHCEGYPTKEYWRSGKQRVDIVTRRVSFDRPYELPILIQGVESEMDKFFLDHFNLNVSRVLSLFTDKQNPFKQILLPMAIRHRGLMHSLLCLSGSHLTSRHHNEDFSNRQHYHFQRAVENLQTDAKITANIAGDFTAPIDDPTVAQTLVLCLQSICAGEVHGEYRPHMDAAKHLIQTQMTPNQNFQNFLYEFFIYHDVSNSITSIDRKSILQTGGFELPEFMIQPEAGALLGVVDGLFLFISRIRSIRDRIRWRREGQLLPLVDYDILTEAQEIDSGLRLWTCNQPADSPRFTASMLYRQCTWLYLHRTILPSTPNESLRLAVDEGLRLLRKLPSDASTQSTLLMPLFLLGCSAFHEIQRPEIRTAFQSLLDYSSLGNIPYTQKVVEMVWKMMDAGNEDSWDWETIISKKGWDFLVT